MLLVFTEPTDVHADHVLDKLHARGADVVRFNPADFPSQAELSFVYTTNGVARTQLRAHGRVIDLDGRPIPGLFAAGELVGGLFYFNYPGGTGLMAGAVFGKIAGTIAGRRAAQIP